MKIRSPLPQLQTWTFAENQSWLPATVVGTERYEVSRRLRWFLTGQWRGVFESIAEGTPPSHRVYVERLQADSKGNYSYVVADDTVRDIVTGTLSLTAKLSEFDKFLRNTDRSKTVQPTLVEFADGVMQFLTERIEWQTMSSVLAQVASDSAIDLIAFLQNALHGVTTIASNLSNSVRNVRRRLNDNVQLPSVSNSSIWQSTASMNPTSLPHILSSASPSAVAQSLCCAGDFQTLVSAFDAASCNNITNWRLIGDEISSCLARDEVAASSDARYALARRFWQLHAAALNSSPASRATVVSRCESLLKLHTSLQSCGMRIAAHRVRIEYADGRRNLPLSCGTLPPSLPTDGHQSFNSDDLFEQLDRCRELIDRLRIGALELHSRFDAAFAAELSVLINVVLIKCRSVLTDQAMTRFARRCIWSTEDGAAASEHARVGVFQAQLGRAQTLAELRERLVAIFCRGDSALRQQLRGIVPAAVMDDIVNRCKTPSRFTGAVRGLAANQRAVLENTLRDKQKKFAAEDRRVVTAEENLCAFNRHAESLQSSATLSDDAVKWLSSEKGWFNWSKVAAWWKSAESAPINAAAFANEMLQIFPKTTSRDSWLALATLCNDDEWLNRLVDASNAAKHVRTELLTRDVLSDWRKKLADRSCGIDDLLPLTLRKTHNDGSLVTTQIKAIAFLLECVTRTDAIVRALICDVDFLHAVSEPSSSSLMDSAEPFLSSPSSKATSAAVATMPVESSPFDALSFGSSSSTISSSSSSLSSPPLERRTTTDFVSSDGSSSSSSLSKKTFHRVLQAEREMIDATLQSLIGLLVIEPTKHDAKPGTRDDWIRRFGELELEDVGGEGDCQFRTLAALLHNDPTQFALVRAQIAQYMRSHRDKFELAHWDSHSRKRDAHGASVSSFSSLDEYCDALEADEWGTFATLLAASMRYRCAIQVLSSSNGGCRFPVIGHVSEQHPVPLVIAHYEEFHFVLVRQKKMK